MGNKERAPTELMRQKSCDAVWHQVFEELLEPAVGQRHDIALEPIDLNGRYLEKICWSFAAIRLACSGEQSRRRWRSVPHDANCLAS